LKKQSRILTRLLLQSLVIMRPNLSN
jgi:hypothetical protein